MGGARGGEGARGGGAGGGARYDGGVELIPQLFKCDGVFVAPDLAPADAAEAAAQLHAVQVVQADTQIRFGDLFGSGASFQSRMPETQAELKAAVDDAATGLWSVGAARARAQHALAAAERAARAAMAELVLTDAIQLTWGGVADGAWPLLTVGLQYLPTSSQRRRGWALDDALIVSSTFVYSFARACMCRCSQGGGGGQGGVGRANGTGGGGWWHGCGRVRRCVVNRCARCCRHESH